jgi:predicted dehydrogenase
LSKHFTEQIMSTYKVVTRRTFVKATAASAIAAPMIVPSHILGADAPNSRVNLGFVGVGSRGNSHVNGLTGKPGVQAVAACDVEQKYLDRAKKTIDSKNKKLGREGDCATYKKYEELIARKDIDAVVITTPDHWHTKIAIETLNSGKDVYCEKPLTLTIDEGKMICATVKKTGRVFQVGTQQRSGMQFLNTIAYIRNGGMGKISKVSCSIGGGPKGGPFPVEKAPETLDWDRWQGQTGPVDYRAKRCHYQFRWWYEYSGGKMTDWGAHHVDIAQFGIGMEASGPYSVKGTADHPIALENGMPTKDDGYNTATKFDVKAMFKSEQHGEVEMTIRSDGRNGITFTGEKGEIFVSRNGGSGKLASKPKEPLKVTPEQIAEVYKTAMKPDHYGNWIHCIRERKLPVSDVFSHHRILSTCHLANIAIRLGRELKWDPKAEQMINDVEGNKWLSRKQRAGYEIKTLV